MGKSVQWCEVKPATVTHYFRERLEWSAAVSDEPSWLSFYQGIWPDLHAAIRIEGRCEWQLRGVDRLLVLGGGKQILIDEKKREKDYGDILLEVWDGVPFDEYDAELRKLTARPTKKGWAWNPHKMTDYVAYSIPTAGKAYLLPYELLRMTMERKIDGWKQDSQKYPKAARNPSYWTINVAVPWDVLSAALAETMIVAFPSVLPEAVK